jgi:hypothetical protein
MRKHLQEVNKLKNQNKRRKFYKAIDNLKKGFQPRINGCRNKDGEIIREEGKVLQRWENILRNYKILKKKRRKEKEMRMTKTSSFGLHCDPSTILDC